MSGAPFETALSRRLMSRASAIDAPFDPRAIARAASARHPRHPNAGRPPSLVARGALLAATIGVVVAAVASLAIVGTPRPSPSLVPPERGVFRGIAPPPLNLWDGFSLTTLHDGRVLLVGGYASGHGSALWDPTTEAWGPATTRLGGGDRRTTTLLQDGRVLVTDDRSTAELWDPVTEAWTMAGPPIRTLVAGDPDLLGDGRVLFGRGVAAQVFEPGSEAFADAGPLGDLPWARRGVELADGRVLDVGPVASSIWDPATQATVRTGGFASATDDGWGSACAAVRLADGRVLAIGDELRLRWEPGAQAARHVTDAAIWDPLTGTFEPTGGSTEELGGYCAATALRDGRVLVMGEFAHGTELFELR